MTSLLPPHDWDFSDCKTDELEACVSYEYCRESEYFRTLIPLMRASIVSVVMDASVPALAQSCVDTLGKKSKPSDSELNGLFAIPAAKLLFSLFPAIGFPEFPNAPWLDLKPEDRKRYLDLCKDFEKSRVVTNTPFGPWRNAHVVIPDGKIGWNDWASMVQSFHPGSVQGWFSIPKGITRKDALYHIDKQFQALEKSASSPFLADKGGRPDGGRPQDKLRQLGALRVTSNQSGGKQYGSKRRWAHAVRFTRNYGGDIKTDRQTIRIGSEEFKNPLYGKDANWDQAVNQAKQRLSSYEVAGKTLLDKLSPIIEHAGSGSACYPEILNRKQQ